MSIPRVAGILWLLAAFFLAGCGNSNDSANEGLDKPKSKKEMGKDKKAFD